jgi:hypothetical protein
MEHIGDILDRIIKEEFGGCDPRKDNPCKIQARVSDGMIYVFAVGKWRAVSRAGRKYPPTKKMQAQAKATLRINTGTATSKMFGRTGGGTFDGKEIELVFLPTREENDANLIWKL